MEEHSWFKLSLCIFFFPLSLFMDPLWTALGVGYIPDWQYGYEFCL
jgi:hypothetical protein